MRYSQRRPIQSIARRQQSATAAIVVDVAGRSGVRRRGSSRVNHPRRWDVDLDYVWRGAIDDAELFGLTQSHGGDAAVGWWDRIRPHSLGWISARHSDGSLVGFVNVAWDGGKHAFLLDPKVRPNHQHAGVGTGLVLSAATHAKGAGCEWLHVDFNDDLAPFYFIACGFQPTQAGLIHLPGLVA